MNSDCRHRKRRRQRPLCWNIELGTVSRRTSPRRRARRAPPYWEKFRMRKNARRALGGIFAALLILTSLSCSGRSDPETLFIIIESGPTNLDPRGGLDPHSARIDAL